ncbi:alpha beta-hydrolase [Micractinium conductrix]|uniref:Alpha beta-hydrolase n=1 Tax=Micractinium conductrix TaxID=554055 RepID=A0A2P6VRV7_9CHLO|nr:alpha beta-hydrolase [Micractinium conductrix]|eukprot:PSC76800.1 alpha beta-hydrolase [Micractinium conductrix]
MRATVWAAVLALAALLLAGAEGAAAPRLAADPALRAPGTSSEDASPSAPSDGMAGTLRGSSGDASSTYTAQWWAQQRAAPPPAPWWRGWLPWVRGSTRDAASPDVTLRIAPALPTGGPAAPAELRLPAAALAREQRLGGWAPAANPSDPGDNSYYSYNSSAMTPLVPLWLSWMTDAARMSNRSSGLDFDTAWVLSSYVAISYCNASSIAAWNCSRCDGMSAGVTPEEVVFDDAWDLQGYVGWSEPLQAIVIAFRGTDSHSIYNWVQNMRTWRTDLALGYPGAPKGALVHGGFFYSYNSSALAANVSSAVQRLLAAHPGAPIYATGHSMGGALATLCALDMKLNLGATDVRLYTFGSPRVGNAIFAQWFEEQIAVHWRFTHDRDIVPSVPPGYMGFYHLSREVWLVDLLFGHTLVGVCDATGEDMACHNSMCHLGLCSSVADHLLYLSEMYSPHPEGC